MDPYINNFGSPFYTLSISQGQLDCPAEHHLPFSTPRQRALLLSLRLLGGEKRPRWDKYISGGHARPLNSVQSHHPLDGLVGWEFEVPFNGYFNLSQATDSRRRYWSTPMFLLAVYIVTAVTKKNMGVRSSSQLSIAC